MVNLAILILFFAVGLLMGLPPWTIILKNYDEGKRAGFAIQTMGFLILVCLLIILTT